MPMGRQPASDLTPAPGTQAAPEGSVAAPEVSVIVTTYNWPEALTVALRSLLRQKGAPRYEIVVADDGSDARTAAAIAAVQADSDVPIKHVWQEDVGFRPAAIRNRAIEAARGDYVICMDQDCMAPEDFIARHQHLREAGYFVSGRRTWMGTFLTALLLRGKLRLGGPWAKWILWGALGQITGPFELIPLGARASFRYRKPRDWQRVQTCNVAFAKADWAAIGGFDERYKGHGLEDSDFVVRLIRGGVKRKDGAYASIVLHLNHPRPRRPPESRNGAYFEELLAGERVMAGHLEAGAKQ